ncbi:hypothetical protein SAMN04488057_101141 [Cyclobacterium lianum]|uniref:Uncharacterized protein n=1 Tax=Cyclobacterium lianum TaxID=388280 RepID=A0A1M7I144_9BACT|nr:hypothetical protein [Cyclobacterium lianum]SHM34359.1 hypothetical protein SAMN04488057_101141 [Cyclobacterium lianum]
MQRYWRHNRLIRERLTLLVVMLFCVFVSSSQLEIDVSPSGVDIELNVNGDQGDEPAQGEEKTYVHTAIDAVVPFVLIVMDQAYHFIYEIAGAENPKVNFYSGLVPSHNHLFEILFEQIISVNAP